MAVHIRGSWRFALVALAAALLMPAPAAVASAGGDLLDALKRGGHVIYFRHAATTWSGVDRIEWPRERQRLLSERGIAQSR
ncbi:MAG: hypothetical protein AAGF45_09245, partial [Pseudomonadota bacterium]